MKSPSERRRATRRMKFTIDVLTTIGIFVAVGVVIWRNWPATPPPPIPLPVEPLAVDAAPTKGSPAASIVVVLYSDFECPYCGTFARGTLATVDRLYVASGKVRLVYRYTAPPNHPRALPSAIAAECARGQGRFWDMHDRLFADQAKLDDASLGAHADAIGLDAVVFKSCQADPAIAARIARDVSGSRSLRIGGTPAFFIGSA
ncbi:MAG TPA: thioredoxin domain-containing protein, partial [Vicinamibacterales bacterium]|nr:thioredoxin domain-containing protein [Vicinamibacterales bacterium]